MRNGHGAAKVGAPSHADARHVLRLGDRRGGQCFLGHAQRSGRGLTGDPGRGLRGLPARFAGLARARPSERSRGRQAAAPHAGAVFVCATGAPSWPSARRAAMCSSRPCSRSCSTWWPTAWRPSGGGGPAAGHPGFPDSFWPQPHSPGRVDVERPLAPETRAALAKLGHDITDWPDYDWRAGAVCASWGQGRLRLGGADPRRGAHAIGW